MSSGKVLDLYMTLDDPMRSGFRTTCEDIDCDHNGIVGDLQYEKAMKDGILLVSKKSYDLLEAEGFEFDKGILLENIYVDIDLNHLKQGSIIEIGDVIFEVVGPCNAFGYLYGFDPEIPELLKGNRGIFIVAKEYGQIGIDDEVTVIEEAK